MNASPTLLAAPVSLSPTEFAGLQALARLFGPWARSRRRRRLLFLALAAPGFFAVFSTPLHQNLAILVTGLLMFAAACAFRARTEPVFVRAEAAALWPPSPPPPRPESSHA